ncbi:hypothetical protein [Nonomuraea typhae]|uniref:Sensor domain-containing protein n=1 Tax=Nonomuraea typhae TaxID=2603600 RepID=A0ABW7YUJ7_9ACTN
MNVTAIAAVALAASVLPEGFLQMEDAARGPHKSYEQWAISEKRTTGLLLDPCEHRYWSGGKARDRGRTASRTIVKTVEVETQGEQVALYRDETAARAVMQRFRADLRRCADRGTGPSRVTYGSRPLKVGDEGIRAAQGGFESAVRFVAVRKGAAVMIYMESGAAGRRLPIKDFRPLVERARTMAAQVCRLPEARC